MAATASGIPTPIRLSSNSVAATPTRIPRRRAALAYSPPAETADDDEPDTPGPIKARMNHLNGQVTELVRKQHTMERKHGAEMITMERRLEEREKQLLQLKVELSDINKRATRSDNDLTRCKHEGEALREELHLHSLIQQQKAILAMSQEKQQVLEMEKRLVQAEMERVMRDHKISFFQSREADLVAELEEKEWRIQALDEELASANTSLVHQRAAEARAVVSGSRGASQVAISNLEEQLAAVQAKLDEAETQNRYLIVQSDNDRAAREATTTDQNTLAKELQDKILTLVEQKRFLKDKLASASAEIEELQSAGNEGSSEAVAELRAQLRAAKAEASKHCEEAADALTELELSKEREKTLKAKLQEAQKEQLRLTGVEEELAAIKAATPKAIRKKAAAALAADSDDEAPSPAPPPKKKPGRPKKNASATTSPSKEKPVSKSRVRKTSPVDSGDEDEPKPKAKRTKKEKPAKKSEEAAPLCESGADNKGAASDDEVIPSATEGAPVPEKKKKRKLFNGAPPAFQWDSILNSGDGVIPAHLSPIKSTRTATIPRAGFSGLKSQLF